MKISLNWLSDYVELPARPEDLAARLTMAGLEVEGIERLGEGLDGVVVARILESAPHPDAEKLSVTRIDAGAGEPLQVVCGAKNYAVGDLVPLATVGARLPAGMKIERAKLRGVESFGMLCSEKELGLSDEAAGLMILEPALQPGTPIADALGLRDVVFELNVTPNRGDCLSHLGLAREVAALTGKPLRLPQIALEEAERAAEGSVAVRLEDPDRCWRYAARVLEGVKIGPSPRWMQNRLRAVGVRALSNAVDITNYVLMECGQPLHAFDLDLVAGPEIIVRRAGAGEKMTTLDGKERELSAEDLCICDPKGPSALAGVMGGGHSEVSNKTARILLESAWFAPGAIRRTARRHALHSESSHRFERGIDPEMVAFAQDRSARLLVEHAGATVLRGRVDAYPQPYAPRRFELKLARVGELLGVPVAAETTRGTLLALGFGLEGEGETVQVRVPSWRPDVEGEADCVEELARTVGFANIPAAMPRGAAELRPEPLEREVIGRVRGALAAAGFDEVLNYSFVSAADLEILTPGIAPIRLQNPIAADMSAMCTTRLAGLLGNLKHSRNRQVEDVRLYELGRIYLPSSGQGTGAPADEARMLAGVLAGGRLPLQWSEERQPVDFYDLKGALERLLESLNVRGAEFVAAAAPLLHPRSACEVRAGGKRLGLLGEIHPTVAAGLDLPRGVFVFELNLEALVATAELVPQYRGVPRFPAVLRDVAVVIEDRVAAAAVEAEIRQIPLVEDAILFDVYRGKGIPEGSKSLAFAIRYRAAERTLTEDEINQAHGQVVGRLTEKLGAELRS